jgi:hypothetical protein
MLASNPKATCLIEHNAATCTSCVQLAAEIYNDRKAYDYGPDDTIFVRYMCIAYVRRQILEKPSITLEQLNATWGASPFNSYRHAPADVSTCFDFRNVRGFLAIAMSHSREEQDTCPDINFGLIPESH